MKDRDQKIVSLIHTVSFLLIFKKKGSFVRKCGFELNYAVLLFARAHFCRCMQTMATKTLGKRFERSFEHDNDDSDIGNFLLSKFSIAQTCCYLP